MGTLVAMAPPWPALASALAELGVAISVAEAEYAFRAEISYYRPHHLEGRDPGSLAALRRRCAAALHAALPARAREQISPERLVAPMLGSLSFAAFADAEPTLAALRARGLRLVVASNWDVSLEEVLVEVGLRQLLDGVVTSAAVGAAKPEPLVFERALALAGAEPGRALHVGDSPELDVAGALAAGVEPILIDRGGAGSGADGVRTIASLAELAEIVG